MNKRQQLELMVVLAAVLALMVALPVFAKGAGGQYPYPAPQSGELAIGAVSVAALTLLLVQAIKEYTGIQGEAVRFTALVIGTVLSGIALAIQDGLITGGAKKIIDLLVLAISGGFGSSGLYRLAKMQK